MKQTLLPRLSPRDGLIMALLLALGGTGHSSMLCAQTAISQGKAAPPFQRTEQREPCTDYRATGRPLFGDLHVHTTYSMDAFFTAMPILGGEVLVVSQFTLAADTSRGRRPGFGSAASPEVAKPLYEQFCSALAARWPHISSGVFGADMQVALINDGPVTILLDR